MSLSNLQAAISKGGKKRRNFKSKKERQEEKKRKTQPKKHDVAVVKVAAAPDSISENVVNVVENVASQGGSSSSVADVKLALRERGEPVTLFGENNTQRAARLHSVEESQPEQHHPGQTNVFAQILEKLEAAASGTQGDDETGEDPDLLTLRELVPERSDGREDDVMIYLMALIEMWGRSTESMREKARYKQTLIYILPLFERLAARRLGEEQLLSLENIIVALKAQNFSQAEDDYLLLAIGNSPWPLGVTSVGIHARSAREKISVGATAHVLNDETQRKYIQSVKRLMTWKQQQAQ